MTLPIPFRAAANLPGGRERPPYNARQTGGGTGDGRRCPGVGQFPALAGRRTPCVGADACIGPPSGLKNGGRLRVAARFRPQCRAGNLARRRALRHRCALRGKALPNLAGYFRRKPAMHPSVCALRRIHLPLQGRLWGAAV